MDSNNSAWKWALGAVALLAVILGLWWLASGNGAAENTSPTGVATTTDPETSGPGAVQPQVSSGTVASVIAQVANGGRFNQLLAQSGVSLAGTGPYTVFVATDGAFGRLVPGTINNMSAAELKRTMQYHIVSGKSLDADAVNNGQIQALSRDTLNFSVDSAKKVYVNSGYVLQAYKATNGMVYVINSVLVPPKQ